MLPFLNGECGPYGKIPEHFAFQVQYVFSNLGPPGSCLISESCPGLAGSLNIIPLTGWCSSGPLTDWQWLKKD